jgi:hypothetical protein
MMRQWFTIPLLKPGWTRIGKTILPAPAEFVESDRDLHNTEVPVTLGVSLRSYNSVKDRDEYPSKH